MKDNNEIISLNKEAWNKVAKRYENEYIGKINPLIEFFCEKLPKRAYILDLGSGTGLPYAKLFIEQGFKVLGIDVSAEMIKLAKKNVPKAKFKEQSMTELDYNNEFDGIFSSYSMLLLNPPSFKVAAQKIVCSLKDGGLFYLSLNGPWVEDADVNSNTIVEIMGEKMYSRAYSKEEILKIFNPLGMRLLKFHQEILISKTFGKENMNAYVFMLE